MLILLMQGSNELDSSPSTERSSFVILSAAKDLAADRDGPFAALRVTRCDCSNCQGQFFQIEPCLMLVFTKCTAPSQTSCTFSHDQSKYSLPGIYLDKNITLRVYL